MQSGRSIALLPSCQVSNARGRELSAFSCFFENNFEVCKSTEWVFRVWVIVTDLFQNGAENGMFERPARNAFAPMLPVSRFLNNNNHTYMVTRYGPLPQVLKKHGSSNGTRVLQP